MKKKPKSENKIESKLYSLKEISAYLKLTEEQIIKLVNQGILPAIEVEKQFFFVKEEIDNWILSKMPEEIEGERIKPELIKAPIESFIPKEGIFFISGKPKKDEVLEYLVLKAHSFGCITDPEDFLSCLKAREEMVTTATEEGVAFLHTRKRMPKHILIQFLLIAISKEGLDWGAPDGKLTHVLFLIGMRYDILHLKILGQLARMTKGGLTKKLLAQDTPDGVLKVLKNLEKKYPRF